MSLLPAIHLLYWYSHFLVLKCFNFMCFSVALMPEGDHMNIIDPPGLTVMRIAGGRYRVTGAVSDFSIGMELILCIRLLISFKTIN
jgi:hypothetical protein